MGGSIPNQPPKEAIDLVLEEISNPTGAEAIYEQFPWRENDFQTYCCEILCSLENKPPGLFAALVKTLNNSKCQDEDLVELILNLTFDKKPIPETITADQLSEQQRIGLQAIVNSKPLWSFSSGNLDLIFMDFGLPTTKKSIQAFLDGKITPLDDEWNDVS